MSINCPRCHSDYTNSFQVIYTGGNSTDSFKTLSYSLNTGALGTGWYSGQPTLLVRRASPPIKPEKNASEIIAALLFGTLVAIIFNILISPIGPTLAPILSLVAGVVVFAVIVRVSIDKHNEKEKKWKQDIANWQRAWMCLKCGQTWMV